MNARVTANRQVTAARPCPPGPPVLMLAGALPPKFCGIGDYTAHLARELAAAGARVTVITRRGPSSAGEPSIAGVDVRRMIDDWNGRDVGRVLDVVDELGPETIVHIQYGGFGMRRRPLVNLLPAVLRSRRPGCRVVLTLHEYRAHRLRARVPILPMILASHGVVCVDPPDLDDLRRLARITRPTLACIPISPNIMPVPMTLAQRQRWRLELGFAADDAVVLYFGNIEPLKGFPDLVAAVKSLRRQGLALRLLVVGSLPAAVPDGNARDGNARDGNARDGNAPAGGARDGAWLERHAEGARESLERGLRDGWVMTLPKLPPRRVSRCLHVADAAVFPYVHGARSNRGSLLAAVAHLLPVVTTEGKQTPAGFARQFGVALVPAGDRSALGERLREVLESRALRQRMRTRMATVRQTFSWPEIARRTLAFYRQLQCPHSEPATRSPQS